MRKLIDSVRGPSFADVQVIYLADIDYPGDGIINQAKSGKYDLLVCGLGEEHNGRD